MALAAANSVVELREVLLKDKPADLTAVSPKATVPVLVLPNGQILEESLDIIDWALNQSDPLHWARGRAGATDWVQRCDGELKMWLDRYKYADRFPEASAEHYRQKAEQTLQHMENAFEAHRWLGGVSASVADVAVFPFVRQFAAVEPQWWTQAPYPKVRAWLEYWLDSTLFASVMEKYPRWEPEQPITLFPAAQSVTD
jgi:glutathione S-transferase